MQRFEIGRIVKSRGLTGEIKVLLTTDFPERLKHRKRLFIGNNEAEIVEFKVKSISLAGKFAFYRFAEVSSTEDAEKLIGKNLYISELELPKLKGDIAYLHELIGLKVLSEQHDEIGILNDVFKMPASDVYEVKLKSGKKILIPAVEEFIEEVHLTKGFVKIKRHEEFL